MKCGFSVDVVGAEVGGIESAGEWLAATYVVTHSSAGESDAADSQIDTAGRSSVFRGKRVEDELGIQRAVGVRFPELDVEADESGGGETDLPEQERAQIDTARESVGTKQRTAR